jgi:hydroxymethylbilane synthase
LTLNPKILAPDIRGNVLTRIQKVADKPELDATILALAGITRLGYRITDKGRLEGDNIPPGLLATILDIDAMLPCVGQGAIGIEIREGDHQIAAVCERLNDPQTFQCVTAERAFLAGMGGGCQSPVAAYATVSGGKIHLRALSFAAGPVRRGQAARAIDEALELGHQLASELKA